MAPFTAYSADHSALSNLLLLPAHALADTPLDTLRYFSLIILLSISGIHAGEQKTSPSKSTQINGNPTRKSVANSAKAFSVLFRLEPRLGENGKKFEASDETISSSILVIEKRLDQLHHFNDLRIVAKEDRCILVEIRDLDGIPAAKLIQAITRMARLELKRVHPENRTLAAKVAAKPRANAVPGYKLHLMQQHDDDDNPTEPEQLLISRQASLDNFSIKNAQELYGPYEGQLHITLSKLGGEKMFQLTSKMRHGSDRLAIVIDGEVLSAPTVQAAIRQKFAIAGLGNAEDAKKLADALRNPLPHRLTVEKTQLHGGLPLGPATAPHPIK